MDVLLSVALGLGLAAACGMRVFVPLTALSAAAAAGRVPLAHGWEWIGSLPTLIAFGTAMVFEVLAYAIPWLDHALDTIATPLAIAAGMLVSASVLMDLPPLVKWSIVLIGGGGFAGLMQGATVVTRFKSGVLTAGLANPLVSFAELFGSLVLSVFTLLAPIAALVAVALLLVFLFRRARRFMFGHGAMSSASL